MHLSGEGQIISDEIIKRIESHLIIHSSFINDIGVFYGKMGIVLFFFHYYDYTKNRLYQDFAYELLEEIFEEIDDNISINFESGLCGIGWGIEYLLQNKYIEGESDDIFEEVDKKIMEVDIRKMTDVSFNYGLLGIAIYVNKRLSFPLRKKKKSPFDPTYLEELNVHCSNFRLPEDKEIFNYILSNTPLFNDFPFGSLGLKNGYAGIALKRILL